MVCLFASDYGLPQAGFDPLAGNGVLIRGFEAHRAQLAAAQNPDQLAAMKRVFAKGETVTWCDNGYQWVYDRKVGDFFGAIVAFVIIPWLVLRVAPALAERLGRTASREEHRAS